MRLDVLDHGHPFTTKALFAFIRLMSGHRALHVGFAFNVITRLADTFEFEVGSRDAFDAGARGCLAAATSRLR